MIMGLSKKRKQHPSLIFVSAAECHKYRKIDQENKQKSWFLRKQKERKNFWDEFEELQLESGSDKLNIEDSSLNKPRFDKDNMKVDKKQGDNIYERLGDQDGGI